MWNAYESGIIYTLYTVHKIWREFENQMFEFIILSKTSP